MKKETVVRQNRCDQEMNLLLFGCFFLFMAMQLFVGETQQAGLVNGINMLLYLVFVPGFIFRLGYCCRRIMHGNTSEEGRRQLLITSGRYFGYFLVLTVLQEYIQNGYSISTSLSDALTIVSIPAVAAIFFSMALLLLLVWVFYQAVLGIFGRQRQMMLVGCICLLGVFLRSGKETYAIAAAFVGSDLQHAVPILPYFAYFLLGAWFEEGKPGFQWKMMAGTAAVTVLSLLLYRTPLQNLCRVTASVLPVYLVYAASEGMCELTIRFRPVRFACETIEAAFWLYTLILFALCGMGKFMNAEIPKVILLAAGVTVLVYGIFLGVYLFQRLYSRGAEYFSTKVKHKTAVYFAVYTAAFALLLLLCFVDFLRFEKTLLWKADTVSQYYPRAVYFANYIRELFSNILSGSFKLPMYDFSLGMGSEITYSLEPLYFLFALFGEEHTEFAYNLLILLRFYLSGVTASILFFYFKKDYFTTFIASVVYVFCGFSLFGGARHYMFMVPMIMLPLLVIAVEEILRRKRWYLCTIFVAISLFSNYYYLYMTTLGLAIYFFVRFFCQKEKEKRSIRNFLSNVLIISGSYLLGVAMSCIVLVTTFGLYVGSGRKGDMLIKTPSLFFYSASWLVRCFLSFLTTANSPGEWLKLGFLPIAYLAVVILFLRKGRKELKILSVLAVIMMALPVVGFVFSGFSSVNNRWCYLIAMLVAFVVAECLPELLRMDRREMRICAAAVALYCFLAFCGNILTTKYTKLAALCLLATFVTVLLCQDGVKQLTKYTKQSLLILLTFAMVLQSGHSLFSMSGVVKEYVGPGEAQEQATNTPLIALDEIEDDSFYRAATPKLDYWTIGSPMLLGYNTLSVFNSTLNSSIMDYHEVMGSTAYTATQLFGMSNRVYMNALAAVKYYAYFDEPTRCLPYGYEEILHTEIDGRTAVVCENVNALPLGITYDSMITEDELESCAVLDRQEITMQTAVVAEEDLNDNISHADLAQLQTSAEELEFDAAKEKGIQLTDHALTAEETEDGGHTLKLKFKSRPNSETYLVMENGFLEGDMSELEINLTFKTEGNKVVYAFRPDDYRYKTGQKDYVFNLGYHEEEITSCTVKMDRAGEITFDSFKLYSLPMDNAEEYCNALKENVLEDVVMETNRISGTVSLEEDKLLMLSIPYQKGWTAYVDGQKVDTVRTNYMYTGILLTAGEHTVEMEFAIPGVKYALVIMPGAAVLFVVLVLISRIRRKHKVTA